VSSIVPALYTALLALNDLVVINYRLKASLDNLIISPFDLKYSLGDSLLFPVLLALCTASHAYLYPRAHHDHVITGELVLLPNRKLAALIIQQRLLFAIFGLQVPGRVRLEVRCSGCCQGVDRRSAIAIFFVDKS